MATGMARTSGLAAGTASSGAFHHAPTGARYAITQTTSGLRLSYDRPATRVSGTVDLAWFIGSGKVGRSYAFSLDGFVFQAPASYYSAARRWGLSPGYSTKPYIDLARPIEPACLNCHASQIQHMGGTLNQYKDQPFLEAGVSCERCHGPGQPHIQAVRINSPDLRIVNPKKLDSVRRDSICLQCHLTGAARVARTAGFRPGDRLSDHVAVFVWTGGPSERAATDHAEQLSRSRCQQATGDKLWCGSCHDPHAEPASDQRVAFYRRSCVGCHGEKACPVNGPDCTSCHMPKGRSREGEHVVYTDHTIGRQPAQPRPANEGLRPFWPASEREAALAYAADAALQHLAIPMLERLARNPSTDAAPLAQLAQIYDRTGKPRQAIPLYERVLKLDPLHPSAANLALHRFQAGRIPEAMDLWHGVFERNPSLPGPGINLALAQLQTGDRDAARLTLLRVLRFHPDLDLARKLLVQAR